MLKGLPPATAMALQHAAENPDFADRIFRDYFRPAGFMRWIGDPEAVRQQIATHQELTQRLAQP